MAIWMEQTADLISVFVSRAIGVDTEGLKAAKKAQATDSSVSSMTRHCLH
jgi:transaldolase